jgi:hypothetical protein
MEDGPMTKGRKPTTIADIIADPDEDGPADAANDSVAAAARLRAPKKVPQKERLEVSFARVRLHWLSLIERAGALQALPLLTVIAYQMDMDRFCVPWTAITSETWAMVGECSERQRRTMLSALHLVPEIVWLEYRPSLGSNYVAHKGEWFDQVTPRLVGKEETAYREYLLSPQWLKRRERRLELSGFRCERVAGSGRCGETECLEVHHLHYRTLGREADGDLEVLCQRHHRAMHGLEGV